MARIFASASSQSLTVAKSYLGGASAFTIALWFGPTSLADTVRAVLCNATGAGAYWQLRLDSGVVVFESVGYTGTNPGTSSGITWTSTTPKFVAWRYNGAEWSKWDAGTKTVINAAITFALPTPGAQFDIAKNWSGAYCSGTYAEVALWNVALSDYQMAELAAGVAADVVAPRPLAYWPLRGTNNPELNYAVAADVLTLGNAPFATSHPTIVPPKVADVVEPAWVVDLDPTGSLGLVYGSTRDLSGEKDFDILGAFYPKNITDDIRIVEELPAVDVGVMVPANTVVTFANPDDVFTQAQDWRGVGIKIRYYDLISHALTTEFSGVVIEQDIANNVATFTCSNQDEAILEQLIPAAVIEPASVTTGVQDLVDSGEVRIDVGAPIPVPCGHGGLMAPPYIAYGSGTAITALNGQDSLIGFGPSYTVRKVWIDVDNFTPGLETASLWDAAYGTLTYVSGSVFTVAGQSLDGWYEAGRPIRSSNDSGTTWNYGFVTSVNMSGTTGGTVNLSGTILGGSLGTVQQAGQYAVENTRYSYYGTGGTTRLTTMRLYGNPSGAVLAEVGESTRANPADAIKFILSDPDVGLGESIDGDSFDAAATAFSDAGLDGAVRDVLGGDKQRRPAVDVINELCSMRGAYIWKDADTLAWKIHVDSEPSASVGTFEIGPTTATVTSEGNVKDVPSITLMPLDQAVSTVSLRYDRLGRDRGAKPIILTDHQSVCRATATGKGKEVTFTNPWIRSTVSHLEAARVCYYLAKRLKRQDKTAVFSVQHQGRRVNLGDVVTLALRSSPGVNLTGDWRVVRRERTLTDFLFTAAGPYGNDIYTTDASTINAYVAQPDGDINPGEREEGIGADANLILNSDWTGGLRTQTWDSSIDVTAVPAWGIVNGGQLTSLSVTKTPSAKGGAYIQFVTVSNPSADVIFSPFNTNDPFDSTIGAVTVRGNRNYVFSVYCNRETNFRLQLLWLKSGGGPVGAGTFIKPPMRVAPGDVNGLGFKRIYCVVSAPPTAVSAFIYIVMHGATSGAITYRFDAVQFEELTRGSAKPTPWKRNNQYGIDTTSVLPGHLTVRGYGEIEHGTRFVVSNGAAPGTAPVATTLTGGTVTIGTVQPGYLTAVSGRVTTGIAGPASWTVALNYGGGTVQPLTSAIGTAVNTTFADAENIAAPLQIYTATPIVAIAASGTFSAGAVRVSPHIIQHVPPSS